MNKNEQNRTAKVSITPSLPDAVMQVVEAIETDIIRSKILPHKRLIEDHLMEDYGAKRHVVRAALAELQRVGVVVKRPYVGAEIRRFDQAALEDLYNMRSVLHRAAVDMMPLPATPHEIAALQSAQQAHADAAASADLIAIHRTNMAFHRHLYGLCHNPYLEESILLHDWLSFPARAYGVADTDALKQACEEHRAMVDAVRDADRATLAALTQHHMTRARSIYVSKFFPQ